MGHTSHVPDLGVPNGIATLDGAGEVPASQLANAAAGVLSGIGSPTFQTVQEMVNTLHGAGCIAGGGITVNGTDYDVAAGQGVIHTSASPTAPLQFFDWVASTSRPIADGEVRWVYIDYNGGTPIVQDTLTFGAWDGQTSFPLGSVAREGSIIYVMDAPQKVSDNPALSYQWFREVGSFFRDNIAGGLVIGNTGTRNVSVTGGSVWVGLSRKTLSVVDTSAADTFDYYYRDGVGGWNKLTAQTQWSSTQWDDGSGTLATLQANRYAAVWIYRTLDSDSLALVFGQAESTSQATIEDMGPPLLIPSRLQASGFLVGRFIIQESTDTPVDEQSIYAQTFNAATLTDHGQLAGLAQGDDHTQYQLRSEQDQANGYPSLDGASQVPLAQIPTITNAKLSDMVQSTIKGRAAGAGTGAPTDLTSAQATAILDLFTDVLKGLVPASGGGTANFLRADGAWAAPPGGGGSVPPDCWEADDETTDTTTSTTFVSLTAQSITPGAGEYLVSWSGEVSGSNGRVVELAVFVNGVQENRGGLTQSHEFTGTGNKSMMLHGRVTAAAGQAVDVRYRAVSAVAVNVHRKTLSLVEVTAAN